MYLSVCATPSASAALVLRLATALVHERHPDAPLVYSNDGPVLAKSLKEAGQKPALLYFDFPDATIASVMTRRNIPTILVWEPFDRTVAYCMAAWGHDVAGAVRFVTRSCSLLHAYAQSASISVVRPLDIDMTVDRLVVALAARFRIALTKDVLLRILQKCQVEPGMPVEAALTSQIEQVAKAQSMHQQLSIEERRLIDEVAAGYESLMLGKRPPALKWPAHIFLKAGDQAEGAVEAIDLTGPARILSFGPYLHLPVGNWLVELRFHVADNHSGNSIMIEVTSGSNVLASAYGRLPPTGAFAMRVPFAVLHAHMPVEIRSVLAAGAIEGTFRLLDAIVEPQSTASQPEAIEGSVPGQ